MSTDERMDALLREAGERWREANTEPVVVDFTALGSGVQSDDLVPIVPPPAQAPRRRHTAAWLATAVGIAAAVVAALVVIGTGGGDRGSAPADGATPLVGTDWRLSRMTNELGTALTVVEPAPLRFGKGTIGGTDACNHLGGPVTIGASTIQIGQLATTEMACIDRPAGFDAEVAHIHAVLNGTVQWAVRGDELTLTGPAGTLVYTAVRHTTTTDPSDLVGLLWTVTEVQQGTGSDGTVSSTAGPPEQVRFVSEGGFRTGCRLGHAEIGDGRLTGMTQSPVPGCTSVDPQADAVMARVLSGDAAWSITDGRLTITKPGEGTLVFTSSGPETVTDPAALTGFTWTHDRGAQGKPVTLRFDGTGGYVAFEGCQDHPGAATLGAGRMTLRPAPVPAVPNCTPGPMPTGTVTWSITGDKLTIREADGTVIVYVRTR